MGYLAEDTSRDAHWASSHSNKAHAVAAWTSLVSAEIAEMAVEAEAQQNFGASWQRYGVGPIDLNFLTCVPQRVRRSSEMIAKSRAPSFEMLFARRGRIVVSHASRNCVVPEGGFVLLEDQSAYTLDFPDGCETLTAKLPDRWLKQWIPSAYDLIGRPLGVGQVWARPLVSLLTTIADAGLLDVALPRTVIADQIGAMCAMLTNPSSETSKAQNDLIAKIYRAVRQNYADPEFCPGQLADNLGISRRHLHRVIATHGTTFGEILHSTRLQKAEQLLVLPQHARTPIGDIAWQVGFADQSHFARLFRSHAGISPTTFRKARQGTHPTSQ